MCSTTLAVTGIYQDLLKFVLRDLLVLINNVPETTPATTGSRPTRCSDQSLVGTVAMVQTGQKVMNVISWFSGKVGAGKPSERSSRWLKL